MDYLGECLFVNDLCLLADANCCLAEAVSGLESNNRVVTVMDILNCCIFKNYNLLHERSQGVGLQGQDRCYTL